MRHSYTRVGMFLVAVGFTWQAAVWMHAQGRTLIGYSPANGQAELDWEKKIQAIPQPDNIKANMMQLAAEPHHLGSPRQHENALWLQRTLRSYGLDAQIEQFDVLFSTPVERKVELTAPTTVCREAERAGSGRRSHVRPVDAAPDIPGVREGRRRHGTFDLREQRRAGRLQGARSPAHRRERRDRDREVRKRMARAEGAARCGSWRSRMPDLFRPARRWFLQR